MKRIETVIHIDAPPARVWEILTDFASYRAWNPFITDAAGKAAAGQRLNVFIVLPGRRGMRLNPVVVAAEAAGRFAWRGKLVLPGIFDGHHIFQLVPEDGGTLLIHAEEFTGFLVPLVWRGIKGATRAGFELMNQALKERCETGANNIGPAL